MDSSIILARFWGIISTVLGLSLLVNPKSYFRLVDVFEAEALRFPSFFAGLVIGAMSVSVLNQWTLDYRGLITFLGWASCIKCTVGIVMPDLIMRIVRRINNNVAWLYPSGIGLMIAGCYLLVVGFGS